MKPVKEKKDWAQIKRVIRGNLGHITLTDKVHEEIRLVHDSERDQTQVAYVKVNTLNGKDIRGKYYALDAFPSVVYATLWAYLTLAETEGADARVETLLNRGKVDGHPGSIVTNTGHRHWRDRATGTPKPS